MSRPVKRPRFTPKLSALEDRSVPSGNVTANLVGTTLHVSGDADDNSIRLQGQGLGVVEIKGINTTVNGSNKSETFTNITKLIVETAEGDDTIRSQGLAIGEIDIAAGAGDDTVRLAGTTGGLFSDGRIGLSLSVNGEDSGFDANETNGNDTISVVVTNVRGEILSIYLLGDGNNFSAAANGHDTFAITDTTFVAESPNGETFIHIGTAGGYSLSGPGDDFQINNVNVTANVAGNIGMYFYIQGSSGDDQFRINNVDVQFNSNPSNDEYVFQDWYVDGGGVGFDVIECKNVDISMVTPYGQGGFLSNGLGTGFSADIVRLANITTQAGGVDSEGFVAENSFGVVANEIDLRNILVTSIDGGAYMNLATLDVVYGEPAADDTISLKNVAMSHSPEFDQFGYFAQAYIYSGDGNDRVTVVNSTIPALYLDLGDGDDTVTILNSTFAPNFDPFHYSGVYIVDVGGKDQVMIVNSKLSQFSLDLGAGDDGLTLLGNRFGTVTANLGDGDDTAILVGNCAYESINIDGGDGFDTLFAWLNYAPILAFDNFEN